MASTCAVHSAAPRLIAGAVLLLGALLLAFSVPAKAQPKPSTSFQTKPQNEVKIGYLHQLTRSAAPPASRLDAEPDDIGVAGAETALRENNSAGQFMGDHYSVVPQIVPPDGDAKAALQTLMDDDIHFVIVDAPAKTLLTLADVAMGKDVLLFNVRATDTALRQEQCRSDVLHVAPDRTMLADALAQYLVAHKWTEWLLVAGPTEDDRNYAKAIERAAERFGATIVDRRAYEDVPGRDRDEIGTVPGPSQGAGEDVPSYDVIVVADEERSWSPYTSYRGATRPVVGSAGLMPLSWHGAHSKWGARQLNAHFEDEHDRPMLPVDYHAYVAARSVGDAVTRNRNAAFQTLRDFIHDEKFQLNGFKGIKHTYRAWDGQFRQPILLVADNVVVSVSPQPGFPHPSAPDRLVDTLGIDVDESRCEVYAN